jgi:hypothetical protein
MSVISIRPNPFWLYHPGFTKPKASDMSDLNDLLKQILIEGNPFFIQGWDLL